MAKKGRTAQLKLIKQPGNTICFIILSQAGFLIFSYTQYIHCYVPIRTEYVKYTCVHTVNQTFSLFHKMKDKLSTCNLNYSHYN